MMKGFQLFIKNQNGLQILHTKVIKMNQVDKFYKNKLLEENKKNYDFLNIYQIFIIIKLNINIIKYQSLILIREYNL